MLLVPRHQFVCPTVEYSEGVVSDKNSWNLVDKQSYQHQRKSVRFLTLFESGVDSNKLRKGLNTFGTFATKNYDVIDPHSIRKVRLNDPKNALAIQQAIATYTSDVGDTPELVLLVLKSRNVEAYSRFKDVVDRTVGCHSICMTERVFEGGIASSMGTVSYTHLTLPTKRIV